MFAHPWVFIIGVVVLISYEVVRFYFFRHVAYRSSFWVFYTKNNNVPRSWYSTWLHIMRFAILFCLIGALARPRIPDKKTYVHVRGVATMLVLDVSGSMHLFDDDVDQRSRFDVAKKQAKSYILAREHDPIGIVIFGAAALSRCPLTLDKHVLTDIVDDLEIGTINPDGTAFATALALAANRLKHVDGEKIIIALTDGTPSEHDIDPQIALDLACSLGIKIYTIGVGSPDGGYMNHPLYGTVPVGTSLNFELLEHIAQKTGGRCFHAPKPQDVARVYSTIDALEKTENKLPTYVLYHEYWIYCLWAASILFLLYLGCSLMWCVLW